MKPHKWAKEIKAWADGEIIEAKNIFAMDNWDADPNPYWDCNDFKFRIKPQHEEPKYLYVYEHEGNGISFGYKPHGALNMWQTKIIGKIKLEVDDE